MGSLGYFGSQVDLLLLLVLPEITLPSLSLLLLICFPHMLFCNSNLLAVPPHHLLVLIVHFAEALVLLAPSFQHLFEILFGRPLV